MQSILIILALLASNSTLAKVYKSDYKQDNVIYSELPTYSQDNSISMTTFNKSSVACRSNNNLNNSYKPEIYILPI